jgi:hypothetical protein
MNPSERREEEKEKKRKEKRGSGNQMGREGRERGLGFYEEEAYKKSG